MKRTYVVLLSNHTSREDNETRRVKATSEQEAAQLVQFDRNRFSINRVVTLAMFKKLWR